MNLRDTAMDALRHAKKADHAESYVIESVTHAAYIDGGRISNIETKIDSGISVRVSVKNKLGRASVTLDDNAAERCVAAAMRVASFSPKNSGFKGYPMPSVSSVKVNIFDKKIENVTAADLKDIMGSVISSCRSEIPRGLLRLSVIRSVTANTNDLVTEHESTMMYGHFTSMFRGDRNGEGTAAVHGVSLNFDAERIGSELNSKAKASASATPFRGKEKMTMILPPCELGYMIASSAGSALNGENVFYKRSLWHDREEKKVASKALTITDDPTIPGALCSAFDDEGTPAKKKILVDNGILRSFIRDSFIGESTGNGMRRNSTDAQNVYDSAVSIKPMNMIVTPGRYSGDDIIAQTDNGILVEKFAWPECDPLTGRFALEVRCGRLVKNGKIIENVNNALLTGNMISLLKRIEHIGSDPVNIGSVTIPTMSFSGTELIGNE